ncbi:hypothetical protein BLNAU_20657 [Blattamonas nauphoetae]|uniref:Uncharacterized protein n=1 Tax=Blattamonas nauphoetae TaxID=2049346 RepID=A0ABQ9WY10_9EUKA|nr:hypothetical protein BLNAU_20657 [Blattamonas nauphoetae]
MSDSAVPAETLPTPSAPPADSESAPIQTDEPQPVEPKQDDSFPAEPSSVEQQDMNNPPLPAEEEPKGTAPIEIAFPADLPAEPSPEPNPATPQPLAKGSLTDPNLEALSRSVYFPTWYPLRHPVFLSVYIGYHTLMLVAGIILLVTHMYFAFGFYFPDSLAMMQDAKQDSIIITCLLLDLILRAVAVVTELLTGNVIKNISPNKWRSTRGLPLKISKKKGGTRVGKIRWVLLFFIYVVQTVISILALIMIGIGGETLIQVRLKDGSGAYQHGTTLVTYLELNALSVFLTFGFFLASFCLLFTAKSEFKEVVSMRKSAEKEGDEEETAAEQTKNE